MKTNVINSASENVTSFSINEDMLNEKKALKYINKPTMVSEISKICEAIKAMNKAFTPQEYTEANSKKELFDAYGRFYTIYIGLKDAEIEARHREEEKADKAQKAEKKASVEGEKKSAPRVGDAEARLSTYSAELAEKEALVANAEEFAKLSKEDAKAIRHRIASLKRKIERANKALGTK